MKKMHWFQALWSKMQRVVSQHEWRVANKKPKAAASKNITECFEQEVRITTSLLPQFHRPNTPTPTFVVIIQLGLSKFRWISFVFAHCEL